MKFVLSSATGILLIGLTITNLELVSFKPNPFFFLLRLGIILLLLVFFRQYEIIRRTENSFVINAGRESLLIYWLHLQILFRQMINNQSLEKIINKNLGVIEAILLTIFIILIVVSISVLWSWLKNRFSKFTPYFISASITSLIVIFFIT